MKLISCDNCAAVYDQDKMNFSDESNEYDAEGCIREEFCWDGNDFVPFLPCAVCSSTIMKE
jgi:hypothetical protein